MEKKGTQSLNKGNFKWIVGIVAVLFLLNMAGGWYLFKQTDKMMRNELLTKALQLANTINTSEIDNFTGTETDLNSADYLKLKEELSNALRTTPKIQYVYLFSRNPQKKVFFLLDIGDRETALPGQIFKEASPELVNLFDSQQAFVEGPLSDDWATWISALVPVNDSTGKLIAVLGIDNDASNWRWDVAYRAGLPFGFMLILIIFLTLFYLLRRIGSPRPAPNNGARLQRVEIALKSGNWELFPDTMALNISFGCKKLLEINQEKLEYKLFRSLILPEYHQLFDAALKALIEFDAPYDIYFKIKIPQSKTLKEIHSIAIFNKKHRIVLGIFQDITELRQTKKVPAKSEERFRSIFESVSIGLYRTTPEGRILMANPTLISLLGYNSFEDLIQRNLEVEGFEESNTRKVFRHLIETNGEINGFESAWKRKDNSLVFVRESAKVIRDESGVILYYEGMIEDLTAHRQTEEALRKSMEENRVMIDANPDILFKINNQGVILNYHAPLGTKLYAPPEAFLGKKIAEVIPYDIAQKIMETIEVAFQSKQMAVMEYELSKDGKHGYFENRIIPIGNDELLSFVRDISDKKKAEEELRYNYSLLRIAGETAKFGGWSLNLEGNKVIWSDEVANIYGKPKGYVPTFDEAISFYAPNCRNRILKVMAGCAEQGIPFNEELEIINSAGNRIWVRSTGEAHRDEHGTIVKVHGSFQNITESKRAEESLKKNEEKFRILNVSTAEMLLQPNLESLYQYIASSLYKRLSDTIVFYNSIADESDETKLETIVGVNNVLFNKVLYVVGFNPIGKKYKIEPHYYETIESGKIVEFESGLYNFVGGILPEIVAQTIEKIIGIHKIYTIGIWKDKKLLAAIHLMTFNKKSIEDTSFIEAFVGQAAIVIQKMMAERNLKESECQLKELNATKDKFFSIIAHDLKSPFNSIIGFSNILATQIAERDYDGIEKYAGIIQNSSYQAMDLLTNLLEWSRSQTGKMEFYPTYIEIGPLINKAIELFSDSAEQKSVAVYTKFPSNTIAFTDKALVDTVLRNLISNAIKFTNPEGNIVVAAEQSQDEWIVSVSDSGVGMQEDAIKKLFRIDNNYSTLGTQNEKGTGLGLILCKEFVEKQGGKIWVESIPGKGSKFYFSIPNN